LIAHKFYVKNRQIFDYTILRYCTAKSKRIYCRNKYY